MTADERTFRDLVTFVRVSFRMGPDQALYVVFDGDGTVARLAPVNRTGADCALAPVPAGRPGSRLALAAALLVVGFFVARRARALRLRAPQG